MFKSIELKIVLMFICVSIVVLTAVGIIYINVEGIAEFIGTNSQNMRMLIIYIVVAILLIAISGGIVISKIIITPISKLTKNVKRIADGHMQEIEDLQEFKTGNEINDLVQAFTTMTKELKQNLNEVSRQKNQIETILLHMTDGIIAFNLEGEIIHINPAAIKFLSLNQEDNNFEKIFKKIKIDINMEKIIYLENWTSSEQRVDLKDRYVNMFFVPFKDENNKANGVIVLIQDITEHVRLDNMRKEFVADVSHELKTPLTSIMGYSDTLLEGEYDKETENRFIGVISSEAHRMARLVSDLLNLSRYDNNEVKWEKIEFDLGDLVKKCQEKLQIEIEKKEHHVECFVTANVPPVVADRDGVEQVVLNVLSNSIKYTKEKGIIKIYVGFVYTDAYIKIIDNGMGIPTEDLERIFDRFYRVDKARTREMGGTGLGLSIAKEILDRNGGSVDIKSVAGEGTEVVIRIPTKQ